MNVKKSEWERNPLKWYRNALFKTRTEEGVKTSQLEFLIHVYDEGSFGKDLMYGTGSQFSCSNSFVKEGFYGLLKSGHVFVFEERNHFIRKKRVYRISYTGKLIVEKFYKRLKKQID